MASFSALWLRGRWLRGQQRWQQYSAREQRLLLLAGAALSLGAVYWGIWQPLQQAIQRQELRLQHHRQLLQQLHVSADSIRQWQQQQSRAGVPSQAQGSLAEQVSRSAASYSITVTRLQPQDRQIQIGLADLPFNQLLSWLLSLRLQYGIEVAALDLSLGAQGGVVRVDRLQLALP